MDLYKTYYVTFSGKRVDLMNMNKQLIRRYNMQADVVNAQVTGSGEKALVAIVLKNGKAFVYNTAGQLIRK